MVLSDGWEMIKKGRLKIEHDEVRRIIMDDDLWEKAKLILSFTIPIWLMVHFCDSDKAVVGEVYQKMTNKSESIKEALIDHVEIRETVLNIVTSRWEMMNRPLHCLAYALTPYYYSRAWLRDHQKKKPIGDEYISRVYLDVVEKIVRDKVEALKIRKQLRNFVSNTGPFARPQSINDREMLSVVAWWGMYGEITPELHSLATKVLFQSVNTFCAERAWSIYSYIHNVKWNKMNINQGESLVYVHYNHRVVSRYRVDYEEAYKNWDANPNDDRVDVDLGSIENREYNFLFYDPASPFTVHVMSNQHQELHQERGVKRSNMG